MGVVMKRTPRELNAAFDLAQQKIIYLKTRNYYFDPIGNVIHQWITDPTTSNLKNMSLKDDSILKRRQNWTIFMNGTGVINLNN